MDVIGQFAAVGGVFALLFAALWWLRRRGSAGIAGLAQLAFRPERRRLERMEKLVLSPQHTLHLVRLGETALLVAASPSGCSLIQAMPSQSVDTSSRLEAAK